MAETETSKPGRALAANVVALGVVSLLTDISSEMTFTLLPLFLANALGVRTAVIGLIEGVAETTAGIMRIFSGWLSDLWGKRKGLTLIGYGLSAASKPFLYFAGAWPTVLGVRFADRLGKGIRTSPRDALIADSSADTRRGLSFGFHRAADTLGAFIGLAGAAVVVYLTQRNAIELVPEVYRRLVLYAMIPGFLAVAVLAVFVHEAARPRTGKAAPPKLSFRDLDKRFLIFVAIIVIFTLGNSSDAFLVLRAQNIGLSVFAITLVLVGFNAVQATVATPAGALSDRWGRTGVIAAAWALYAAVYLGFGLAQAPWHIWALFLLYGAYHGMAEGTARALVGDVVREDQRGTAYGIYNAAVAVTALPASLIAGALWQGVGKWPGFGAPAPFFFGSAMALLALVLLLAWLPTAKVGASAAQKSESA
ncbi:MAG: MFS transporter [Armatimonadota bacterium]|nr:MAG: MFS transporter [Armatimonadota bacterium]